MPSSPRTPTLEELIAILAAASVSSAETWDAHVELTLKISKAKLAELGVNLLAYPSDVLRGLAIALEQLEVVRTRERAWAASEPPGAALEDCINFLKFQAESINPNDLQRKVTRKLFLNCILRLSELAERRKAGGVYTQADERRAKDSEKWRFEDSPAAEELRKQQERTRRKTSGRPDYHSPFDDGPTDRAGAKTAYEEYSQRFEEMLHRYGSREQQRNFEEEAKRAYTEQMNRMFEETLRSGRYGDYFRDPFAGRTKQPPPSSAKRRWFEVLGVSVNASKVDITRAYRRLAKRFHPDRAGGSHDKMTEINAARDEGLGGL